MVESRRLCRESYGHLRRPRAGHAAGTGHAQLRRLSFAHVKLTEKFTLQARAEGFNIINHTNLGFGTSGAGTIGASMNITSSTFGQLTAAADPRILQFALKLLF